MTSMGVRGSHIPSATGAVDPAKRPAAKKTQKARQPAAKTTKPKNTKGKR